MAQNEEWLSGLNPEQKLAALHNHGPMLILAGAGSGKTTVLVCRTGRLISDQIAKPSEIVLLTFTNKAAREIKERVQEKIGSAAKGIWAGTFHSFGLDLLRRFYDKVGLPEKFGVIDHGDAVGLLKDCLRNVTSSNKESFDVETLYNLLGHVDSKSQQAVIDPEYFDMAQALAPAFFEKLRMLGVVDFECLLSWPARLLSEDEEVKAYIQSRFKFFMVDEFQDTNDIQLKMVQALVHPHQNLTVVGDDDQAIYGWRGANVAHILGFPGLFKSCKVVKLEKNYRSSQFILEVANSVIKNNTQRHAKQLIACKHETVTAKPELFVYEDELQEAQGVIEHIKHFLSLGLAHHDLCVLYRSNSQGAFLETELKGSGIPYKTTGGTGLFSRKEIKDVLAYLVCVTRPTEVAFRRVINVPPRGLGEKFIDVISSDAKKQNLSFYQAARRARENASLSDAQRETLNFLFHHLDDLKKNILQGTDKPESALLQFLERIFYKRYLLSQFKDPQAGVKHWEFIEIFARVMGAFFKQGGRNEQSLLDFVEAMTLGDVPDENQQKSEVQLMTLHACKGLEFKAVMMVGVEEELLPHKKLGSDLSEERRLFYVGLTRAKQYLVLCRAKARRKHGRQKPSSPSRFLMEIAKETIEIHENGFRPFKDGERKTKLGDLLKRLDEASKDKQIVSR